MKITINLISNIFLAGFISILPYLSIIRGMVEKGSENIWVFLPVMITPFIVYIISAVGLEIAEQSYRLRQEKTKIASVYFIMLIATIVVPYILAMFTSYIGTMYLQEISFIIFIMLFTYTFYIFYKGNRLSIFFLLPLLIYKIYSFVR